MHEENAVSLVET